MTNPAPTPREALITQLMREGNDRPTACLIADARLDAAARARGGVAVTDTGGRTYTARILHPGDSYGNGGVWGAASYHDEGRLGITIDGTPATYYADGFVGKAEGHRIGGQLAIDHGQNWLLTEESTLRFYRLADAAFAARVSE